MFQEVRQLLDLITKSVGTLEKACQESNAQLPGFNEPFHHDSDVFRANPAAAEAASIISAAALQLDAIVSPPRNVLYHVVGGHLRSAAARVCLEGHVTEILREAGPDGLHVNDIAAKNGLDSRKLASCLRMLATHHIFREVKPDVFANNRISSLLDTSKESAEIIANPDRKHDDTNGIAANAALAGHWLDTHFKATAYLWESTSDPKTAKSGEPTDTALSRAVTHGKTYWEWAHQPENDFILRRFNVAMSGIHILTSNLPVLSAYDWKSLPANALIVDVGGGIGTDSFALAQEYPSLKFVVQDLQPVVEKGKEVWKNKLPEILSSGRVRFEAHDFFTAQPYSDASIFFVKHVVLNWSDGYASKILKHLRNAATPDTKLVCVDMILPYACRDPDEDNKDGITGAVPVKAPNPLLPNWGAVNDLIYMVDVALLAVSNAGQRTIGQLERLFHDNGWKITTVHRQHVVDLTAPASIVAVPI